VSLPFWDSRKYLQKNLCWATKLHFNRWWWSFSCYLFRCKMAWWIK